MSADASLFDRLAREAEHPSVSANRDLVLSALGYAEDPVLLRRALELSLTLELTPRQVSKLLWQAARRRNNRAILYAWITSEWTRIRTKWKDDVLWPVLGVAELACSDHDRKKLEGVFVDVSINQWN